MKPGEQIKCPYCSKDSFLVKKVVHDGWKKAGEFLCCSSCSSEIEQMKEADSASQVSEVRLSALEALLSEKKQEQQKIHASDEEKRFCRDCMHFISHPFLNRCSYHNKTVETMDDCNNFIRKKGT